MAPFVRGTCSVIDHHRLTHPAGASASLGLEAGETLTEVSDRLGHSSIVITADTYSHIAPQAARKATGRPANLVNEQPAPEVVILPVEGTGPLR